MAHVVGNVGHALLPGHEVDARAVRGGADLLGEECPVVAAVVPGEAARLKAVVPGLLHELDGPVGGGGVDGHLAGLVDLGPAEAPHQGIAEHRRITEGVAQGLTEREALGLALRADSEVLIPGARHLHAEIGVDVRPVGHDIADAVVRDAARHAVDDDRLLLVGVDGVTAVHIEDRAVIDEAARVEVGVVPVKLQDIGACAALDRGRRPRLEVVLVDVLEADRDAGLLLEGRGILKGELVRWRDEVAPREVMHRALLGEGRRDAAEEAEARASRDRGGGLREVATGQPLLGSCAFNGFPGRLRHFSSSVTDSPIIERGSSPGRRPARTSTPA